MSALKYGQPSKTGDLCSKVSISLNERSSQEKKELTAVEENLRRFISLMGSLSS